MAQAKLRFPDRKISDTFLQFAEPLLVALGPDVTEVQVEQALKIAWTVWNAVVYSDVAKNTQILEELRSSIDQVPEIKVLTESLIERKQTLFHDDQRLIGNYELFHKDGEVRLRAEARDPRTTT